MYKVFVYGSLKQGFGNHGFLETSHCLGQYETKDAVYEMYSFGFYPGVSRIGEGGHRILGELYMIDSNTLIGLDKLEGNGMFYTRELVELEDGEEAWMYLLPEPTAIQISESLYDPKNRSRLFAAGSRHVDFNPAVNRQTWVLD
jgi:gamma-glutamylcyclotransferase (GGCT)/AIG2-like uncharacterized protein YtfP